MKIEKENFEEFHKLICNVKKSNPHQIYFDFFIQITYKDIIAEMVIGPNLI